MAIRLPNGQMMDDFGEVYDVSQGVSGFEIDVIADPGVTSGAGKTANAIGDKDQNGSSFSIFSDFWLNAGLGILAILIIVLSFYFGFQS